MGPLAIVGKVRALRRVQLDHGVQALVAFHDFPHLVGGDSVQPAAEGAELDQVDFRMGRRKAGRMVQPGMIAPLVHNAELIFGRIHVVHGIFRHDGQVVRVDVVGPTYQQDHGEMFFFGSLQDFFAFVAHIFPVLLQFFVACVHGRF